MPIYLYIDRGSIVHRLTPTVKVFALFIMFWSVYWVDHPLALLPLGLVMVALAQLTGSWPNFYRLRWLFILLIFFTTLAWMVFYRKGPALTINGASASINAVANFITAMKRSGYFQKVEIKESKQDDKNTGVQSFTFQISAEITPPPAVQARPANAPAATAKAPAKKG